MYVEMALVHTQTMLPAIRIGLLKLLLAEVRLQLMPPSTLLSSVKRTSSTMLLSSPVQPASSSLD